ncbi:MAG: hypothetical protein J6L91_01240 [Clostridia bacterium]|nr:hypothetical protein [Clostridia bacterium]
MAKRGPLTVRMFVILDRDKDPVPFEDLTPEQVEYCRDKWCENLSRRMSDYYSAHPEQFEALKGREESI